MINPGLEIIWYIWLYLKADVQIIKKLHYEK
jgi:hypothetical protein